MISVAALNDKGELADFSNYGKEVDIAAPGEEILSTMPLNNYGVLSGSSLAAPFVTGTAALLKSCFPELTADEIVDRIKRNACIKDMPDGEVEAFGILDVHAVLINLIDADVDVELEQQEEETVQTVTENVYSELPDAYDTELFALAQYGNRHRGDVNNDGSVNSTDYALVKRYLLGTMNVDDYYSGEKKYEDLYSAADVNVDGAINSTDYSMLRRYIQGVQEFPAPILERPYVVYNRSTGEHQGVSYSGIEGLISGGVYSLSPVEGTRDSDYSINAMANNMQRLADLATQYKQSSGINVSVNELVFQYIRRGVRYSGGNWPSVAGQINAGFVTYVGNNSSDLAEYFNDNVVIRDPLTQNEVDFVHWVATLNGLIYDTGWSDTGYKSLIGEAHIDNLCGWAGDLQTLVRDVITQTNNSDDYSVLYARASRLMGTTDTSLNSTFPMNDLLADTDAFNIYNKLGSSSLVNAFKTYYSGGNSTRYADFTGNRNKEAIRSLAGTYTDDWLVWPVTKWPLLNGVDVSDNQSKAVRDAFTDFIWNKVQGGK